MPDIPNNERITRPTYYLSRSYRLYLRCPHHTKSVQNFLKDQGNLASLYFFSPLVASTC
ncbi:conserved hypothetical protein [mine drainage metagenome]|uniref:Uncharacterized protein n=1 Tax=mine drainage metagenome TaxID=410659 RepID=A0A3P3ZRW7_9ZZZZ